MWWAGLKFLRLGASQALPLLDVVNRPCMVSVGHQRVVQRLHRIDTECGALISTSEAVTNPSTRDRYLLNSLISEAITSSQLEGAATTRAVAQEMLQSRRAPRDRSERMIFNNFITMERISALRDEPLTPAMIYDLHALVTSGTLDKPDAAGRLRRADEDIAVLDNDDEVLHDPPAASELPRRLQVMCDFANAENTDGAFFHPVARAIVLHFWLAYDHPFVDGNGRTARALFYWAMLRQKYWLFEYISISEIILKAPAKYGRAFLLTETDGNDLTYFLLYHLDVICQAIDGLQAWIARKTDDVRTVDAVLRDAGSVFNHRQRAVLARALRHPTEPLTIGEHKSQQQVVYETARTDLLQLVDHRLLVQSKEGRKLVFLPARGLEKLLKRLGDAAG